MVVETSHPLQGCQFHFLQGFLGCTAVGLFGLIQPIDHLGQRVAATVATAAQEDVYTSHSQAFSLEN
jgi:hypothetical protein